MRLPDQVSNERGTVVIQLVGLPVQAGGAAAARKDEAFNRFELWAGPVGGEVRREPVAEVLVEERLAVGRQVGRRSPERGPFLPELPFHVDSVHVEGAICPLERRGLASIRGRVAGPFYRG